MLNLITRLPYWLAYVVLLAVLFGVSYLIPDGGAIPIKHIVEKPDVATLEAVKSIVTLMTALNTTMMTAAAAVAVKGKDWSDRWSRVDGAVVMVVFICGSVSYYGIYLGSVAILEMVEAGAVGISSPRLQWSIAIQYYATLSGFALLGLVFSRMMEGRLTKPPNGNAPKKK